MNWTAVGGLNSIVGAYCNTPLQLFFFEVIVRIPFELYVGLRYLKAKRRQTFISLISVISVAGVALGVMALIVVLSVMNGFQNDIRSKIIDTQAHVIIASYDRGGIQDWKKVLRRAEAHPGVAAVSPYLANQVMLKHDQQVQGVMLWGIEPKREAQVTQLAKNLKTGSLAALNQAPKPGNNPLRGCGIILGSEIARKMGLLTGDELTVVAPVFKVTAAGTMPKMATFQVVGVFEAGMYEYDANFAYVSLETIQQLFELPNAVNGFSIRVKHLEAAAQIADDLQKDGNDYWARDFMSMNRNLATALKVEKMMMFIILILIVMVAAFNIASTLIMVVMEKKKDIGILKAIGADRGMIMRIFMWEGSLVGLSGTLLGLTGGLVACLILKLYPLHIPGGGSVYYIENLPVATQGSDVAIITATAVVVCLLSTFYPAWQASRLDPVEAIRYE
jgi:lipoprotein-releasing system permease protein